MNTRTIEEALQVSLPNWYSDIVERALKDGGYQEIMSNEFDIIEWNKKYRFGYSACPPWPNNLFLIGDDGAASCYAIDLSKQDKKIFLFDHGNPNKILEEVMDVNSWVEETSLEYASLKCKKPQKITIRLALLIGIGVILLSFSLLSGLLTFVFWFKN